MDAAVCNYARSTLLQSLLQTQLVRRKHGGERRSWESACSLEMESKFEIT